MSNPNASVGFWSDLISLNKHVDGLIDRVRQEIEPSQPISREVPILVSIEAEYDNLPTSWASVVSPSSDAIAGNNIKKVAYNNGSSRAYVREIGFQPFFITSNKTRTPDNVRDFPFNFRWNFQTSITQRWYSQRGRVLAQAGGRFVAGNHLAFREPLIIEPMETFTFECELLSSGMSTAGFSTPSACGVAMILSGYREGI